MKNLKISLLILALGMGGFFTVNAAAINTSVIAAEQEPKQEKVEEEVEMENLPTEVQKDIKIKYPDADFVRASRITKTGEDEGKYKVVLDNDGNEVTLTYDAKGKALK